MARTEKGFISVRDLPPEEQMRLYNEGLIHELPSLKEGDTPFLPGKNRLLKENTYIAYLENGQTEIFHSRYHPDQELTVRNDHRVSYPSPVRTSRYTGGKEISSFMTYRNGAERNKEEQPPRISRLKKAIIPIGLTIALSFGAFSFFGGKKDADENRSSRPLIKEVMKEAPANKPPLAIQKQNSGAANIKQQKGNDIRTLKTYDGKDFKAPDYESLARETLDTYSRVQLNAIARDLDVAFNTLRITQWTPDERLADAVFMYAHKNKIMKSTLFEGLKRTEGTILDSYSCSSYVPTINVGSALVVNVGGEWQALPEVKVSEILTRGGTGLSAEQISKVYSTLKEVAVMLNDRQDLRLGKSDQKDIIAKYVKLGAKPGKNGAMKHIESSIKYLFPSANTTTERPDFLKFQISPEGSDTVLFDYIVDYTLKAKADMERATGTKLDLGAMLSRPHTLIPVSKAFQSGSVPEGLSKVYINDNLGDILFYTVYHMDAAGYESRLAKDIYTVLKHLNSYPTKQLGELYSKTKTFRTNFSKGLDCYSKYVIEIPSRENLQTNIEGIAFSRNENLKNPIMNIAAAKQSGGSSL